MKKKKSLSAPPKSLGTKLQVTTKRKFPDQEPDDYTDDASDADSVDYDDDDNTSSKIRIQGDFRNEDSSEEEYVFNLPTSPDATHETSEDDFIAENTNDNDVNHVEEAAMLDNKSWGGKKKSFYNTDYIEEDYGDRFRDSDEEEAARLEEEEALQIQKKLLHEIEEAYGTSVFIENKELLALKHPVRLVPSMKNALKKQQHSHSNRSFDMGTALLEEKQKNDLVQGTENITSDEKRAINYQIAKNKGLNPHRKKELKNPRVKQRARYRKALIRRKGQVQQPRTEINRYGGEISGIRTTVVKSVKIS